MNTDPSKEACSKCGGAIPPDAPRGLCPKCVFADALTQNQTIQPPVGLGDAPTLERVSAAFPQLEVQELVGRGGMGFVFKARQPHLDRWVALKLLPEKLAHDPQFAERFNREGRVLARLNHPNIVTVFDFGKTADFYFLIMEFVDGVNLRQAMQAGRFSPREALQVVPPICTALQYAHEQGVLHRDIKPENILLDAKGRVKIADFGIAKLIHEDPMSVTLTGTGAKLGTPHYMAPEQFEAPSGVDHRADIYSLGVVFYEMLTGELPIGRFEPPSAKTPVGKPVDEVVFRTLEKDREKRFQSAGDMKTSVENLATAGADQNSSEGQQVGEVGAASAVPARPICFRAVIGAGLVGVSFVMPLASLARPMHDASLAQALLAVAMPGLGGTLVGWLGLNEIRSSGGRLRGLPFGVFATLAWALIALIVFSLGVCFKVFRSVNPGMLPRVGMLFLPAGVITFAIWSIYTTARWAMGKPARHERGVLKWVFSGLLVAGMAWVSLRSGLGTPKQVPASELPASAPGPSVVIEPALAPGQPAADRLREFGWNLQLRDIAGLTGNLTITSNGIPVQSLPYAFHVGPIGPSLLNFKAAVRSRGVVPSGEPAWEFSHSSGDFTFEKSKPYIFLQKAPVRWKAAVSTWPKEVQGPTSFDLVLFQGVQDADPARGIPSAWWEARFLNQISYGPDVEIPHPDRLSQGSLELKVGEVSSPAPGQILIRFEWLHRGGCMAEGTLHLQKEPGTEESRSAVEQPSVEAGDVRKLALMWHLPSGLDPGSAAHLVQRIEAAWKGKSILLPLEERVVLFEDVLEDGTCLQARLSAVKEQAGK